VYPQQVRAIAREQRRATRITRLSDHPSHAGARRDAPLEFRALRS
jgi:hypothetical protein